MLIILSAKINNLKWHITLQYLDNYLNTLYSFNIYFYDIIVKELLQTYFVTQCWLEE